MKPGVKRIAVQGSTGSIGISTLEIISSFRDNFSAFSLIAWENVNLLAEQIEEFRPEIVSVKGEREAERLWGILGSYKPKVVWGGDGIEESTLQDNVDIVLAGARGTSCLVSVLKSLKAGKRVALANKELLVAAGKIVMRECEKGKGEIIPVDSEHSAIFQALSGHDKSSVKKIILTASGGPFYFEKERDLSRVTPEEATSHPVWNMGAKISVDSATMMNKGYELIEAMHLFNIPQERIEIVIHPGSAIHSMVEFVDGTVIAQMGVPDMKIPITYALSYPERYVSEHGVDIVHQLNGLKFYSPDEARFPLLSLARRVAVRGGILPAVMCGANDMAVELFLDNRMKFTHIPLVVEKVVNSFDKKDDVEPVLSADKIEETILKSANLTVKILERLEKGAR